jgi:hypothetical protein
MGRAVLGFVLSLLGYPDQGRTAVQQALAHAQEIKESSTTAFAHVVAAVSYFLSHDVTAALRHSEALRSLGQAGLVYGVWAELLAREAGTAGPEPGLGQGLARAPEAGSTLQTLGPGVGQAVQLLVQAHLLVQVGQIGTALRAMDQAQAWIERSGVQVLEAEVWRMRGELLLMADEGQRTMDDEEPASSAVHRPSSSRESQACFQRALEIARGQQARWLELRAAVSLARLWQGQDRRDDARDLLAGIYSWFSEGFDTVDLVEAQALLAELG